MANSFLQCMKIFRTFLYYCLMYYTIQLSISTAQMFKFLCHIDCIKTYMFLLLVFLFLQFKCIQYNCYCMVFSECMNSFPQIRNVISLIPCTELTFFQLHSLGFANVYFAALPCTYHAMWPGQLQYTHFSRMLAWQTCICKNTGAKAQLMHVQGKFFGEKLIQCTVQEKVKRTHQRHRALRTRQLKEVG